MGVLGSFLGGAAGTLGQQLVQQGLIKPLLIDPRERKQVEAALRSLEETYPQIAQAQVGNAQLAHDAALSGQPLDPSMLQTPAYGQLSPELGRISGGLGLVKQMMDGGGQLGGFDYGGVLGNRVKQLDEAYGNVIEDFAINSGLVGPMNEARQGNIGAPLPGLEERLPGIASIDAAENRTSRKNKLSDVDIQQMKGEQAGLDRITREKVANIEQRGTLAHANAMIETAKERTVQQQLYKETVGLQVEDSAENRKAAKREEDVLTKEIKKSLGKATTEDMNENMAFTNPDWFEQTREYGPTGELTLINVPKSEFSKEVRQTRGNFNRIYKNMLKALEKGDIGASDLMSVPEMMDQAVQMTIDKNFVGPKFERKTPPTTPPASTSQPAPAPTTPAQETPAQDQLRYDPAQVANNAISQLEGTGLSMDDFTDDELARELLADGYSEQEVRAIIEAIRTRSSNAEQ